MDDKKSGAVPEDIERRTFKFAVRIIKMVLQLPKNPATWKIGGQVINSSTSINSNIVQARAGISKKDFTNHMRIALKEAKETEKWIEMIVETGLTTKPKTELLIKENNEIIKILVTIIKKSAKN
jgi:four helix bundle protein